ncbi:MAG: hypothetical protein ABEJ02_02930 [Candidatus Paceibacteria bacterium]
MNKVPKSGADQSIQYPRNTETKEKELCLDDEVELFYNSGRGKRHVFTSPRAKKCICGCTTRSQFTERKNLKKKTASVRKVLENPDHWFGDISQKALTKLQTRVEEP